MRCLHRIVLARGQYRPQLRMVEHTHALPGGCLQRRVTLPLLRGRCLFPAHSWLAGGLFFWGLLGWLLSAVLQNKRPVVLWLRLPAPIYQRVMLLCLALSVAFFFAALSAADGAFLQCSRVFLVRLHTLQQHLRCFHAALLLLLLQQHSGARSSWRCSSLRLAVVLAAVPHFTLFA